jgi:hypothetical protein
MQITVLHLIGSFSEASAASVSEFTVVERISDPVDLSWSEDLVVISFYFEGLFVI